MTNVAFIPVRGGSKSIPHKNIKLLADKPLVYYVAATANQANCIDQVIIATDDPKIKKTVLDFHLPKISIYNRQPINATDTASTESVMLEYLQQAHLQTDDLFFLIQATSPLLQAADIENLYQTFKLKKADSALTCVRNKRFFWHENGTPINYDYHNRPRRQDFSGQLMENGACYLNSVGNILRDKNRLSGKIAISEMPEETGIEIDEPIDFLILEQFIKH